jgi:sarcosine oxidase subunit beta
MTTMRSDVCIVGGGLVGTWSALFLRRRGRSVVLVEKGSVGEQASGVNFGNVRLQGRHPSQYPLSLRSQAIWERLEELVGDRCEYSAKGHLYLALCDADMAKLERCANEARAHGIAIDVMDGNEARRRWPWLGPPVRAASFSSRDATANPRLVTPAVARAAMAAGAQVLERRRVTEMTRHGDGFRVATADGLVVECSTLLNAAGAWGAAIAERFGEKVPLFAAGPPQFVTDAMPYVAGPSVQALDGSVIFRQVERGNVIVAGFPRGPSDPTANKAPVQPAKTIATMNRLAEVAPPFAAAHVIRVWSGIEGYLPDMLPVIGPSATTPGLVHAFGFCGHGFQVGPGVGDCLAEIIDEGSSRTPLADFSITRFAGAAAVDDKIAKEFDVSLSIAAGHKART